MSKDFSKFLIKNYKYWEIHISKNQGYLGRCIVWCKRENALDLPDATSAEQDELFLVLNDLREAIRKTFQADWFNYAFLGNDTKHLHCHFIPRYAKPKKFMNIVFKDTLYGHNYKTDAAFKIPENVLLSIKKKIQDNL